MITIEELLSGNKWEDVPKEHQENLKKLLDVTNKFRTKFGSPMIVDSGYRSWLQHVKIYADKGIRDLKLIPRKSNHLYGLAVDFYDPDGKLKVFINNNLDLMEELGLWFEDFRSTSNWVHMQIVAPASGKRFFLP